MQTNYKQHETPQGGEEGEGGIWNALMRGTDQSQSLLYAFVDIIGEATGIDLIEEFGEAGVKRNIESIMRNKPKVQSWDDVEGLGSFGTYVIERVLEQVPSLLAQTGATIAGALAAGPGGGAGAAVASSAARAALGKELARVAGRKASQGFVERQVARMATREGAAGATAGAAYAAMEGAGETQLGFTDEGIEAPFTALGTGIAKGVLDQIGLESILGAARYTGDVPEAVLKKAMRLVRRAGAPGLAEGGTEALQTALDQIVISAKTGNELFTEENFKELKESAIAGATVGSAFSAAAASYGMARDSEAKKKDVEWDATEDIDAFTERMRTAAGEAPNLLTAPPEQERRGGADNPTPLLPPPTDPSSPSSPPSTPVAAGPVDDDPIGPVETNPSVTPEQPQRSEQAQAVAEQADQEFGADFLSTPTEAEPQSSIDAQFAAMLDPGSTKDFMFIGEDSPDVSLKAIEWATQGADNKIPTGARGPSYESLSINTDQGLGKIYTNNPEKMNALNDLVKSADSHTVTQETLGGFLYGNTAGKFATDGTTVLAYDKFDRIVSEMATNEENMDADLKRAEGFMPRGGSVGVSDVKTDKMQRQKAVYREDIRNEANAIAENLVNSSVGWATKGRSDKLRGNIEVNRQAIEQNQSDLARMQARVDAGEGNVEETQRYINDRETFAVSRADALSKLEAEYAESEKRREAVEGLNTEGANRAIKAQLAEHLVDLDPSQFEAIRIYADNPSDTSQHLTKDLVLAARTKHASRPEGADSFDNDSVLTTGTLADAYEQGRTDEFNAAAMSNPEWGEAAKQERDDALMTDDATQRASNLVADYGVGFNPSSDNAGVFYQIQPERNRPVPQARRAMATEEELERGMGYDLKMEAREQAEFIEQASPDAARHFELVEYTYKNGKTKWLIRSVYMSPDLASIDSNKAESSSGSHIPYTRFTGNKSTGAFADTGRSDEAITGDAIKLAETSGGTLSNGRRKLLDEYHTRIAMDAGIEAPRTGKKDRSSNAHRLRTRYREMLAKDPRLDLVPVKKRGETQADFNDRKADFAEYKTRTEKDLLRYHGATFKAIQQGGETQEVDIEGFLSGEDPSPTYLHLATNRRRKMIDDDDTELVTAMMKARDAGETTFTVRPKPTDLSTKGVAKLGRMLMSSRGTSAEMQQGDFDMFGFQTGLAALELAGWNLKVPQGPYVESKPSPNAMGPTDPVATSRRRVIRPDLLVRHGWLQSSGTAGKDRSVAQLHGNPAGIVTPEAQVRYGREMRQYAKDLVAWKDGGEKGDPPAEPVRDRSLSQGAQAKRNARWGAISSGEHKLYNIKVRISELQNLLSSLDKNGSGYERSARSLRNQITAQKNEQTRIQARMRRAIESIERMYPNDPILKVHKMGGQLNSIGVLIAPDAREDILDKELPNPDRQYGEDELWDIYSVEEPGVAPTIIGRRTPEQRRDYVDELRKTAVKERREAIREKLGFAHRRAANIAARFELDGALHDSGLFLLTYRPHARNNESDDAFELRLAAHQEEFPSDVEVARKRRDDLADVLAGQVRRLDSKVKPSEEYQAAQQRVSEKQEALTYARNMLAATVENQPQAILMVEIGRLSQQLHRMQTQFSAGEADAPAAHKLKEKLGAAEKRAEGAEKALAALEAEEVGGKGLTEKTKQKYQEARDTVARINEKEKDKRKRNLLLSASDATARRKAQQFLRGDKLGAARNRVITSRNTLNSLRTKTTSADQAGEGMEGVQKELKIAREQLAAMPPIETVSKEDPADRGMEDTSLETDESGIRKAEAEVAKRETALDDARSDLAHVEGRGALNKAQSELNIAEDAVRLRQRTIDESLVRIQDDPTLKEGTAVIQGKLERHIREGLSRGDNVSQLQMTLNNIRDYNGSIAFINSIARELVVESGGISRDRYAYEEFGSEYEGAEEGDNRSLQGVLDEAKGGKTNQGAVVDPEGNLLTYSTQGGDSVENPSVRTGGSRGRKLRNVAMDGLSEGRVSDRIMPIVADLSEEFGLAAPVSIVIESRAEEFIASMTRGVGKAQHKVSPTRGDAPLIEAQLKSLREEAGVPAVMFRVDKGYVMAVAERPNRLNLPQKEGESVSQWDTRVATAKAGFDANLHVHATAETMRAALESNQTSEEKDRIYAGLIQDLDETRIRENVRLANLQKIATEKEFKAAQAAVRRERTNAMNRAKKFKTTVTLKAMDAAFREDVKRRGMELAPDKSSEYRHQFRQWITAALYPAAVDKVLGRPPNSFADQQMRKYVEAVQRSLEAMNGKQDAISKNDRLMAVMDALKRSAPFVSPIHVQDPLFMARTQTKVDEKPESSASFARRPHGGKKNISLAHYTAIRARTMRAVWKIPYLFDSDTKRLRAQIVFVRSADKLQVQLYQDYGVRYSIAGNTTAMFIPPTGMWGRPKVYLVTENIDTPTEAIKYLRHEMIAHYGVASQLSPKEKAEFFKRISESDHLLGLKKYFDQVRKTHPEMSESDQIEEVLGKIAEDMPLDGADDVSHPDMLGRAGKTLRRAWAGIKRLLMKLFKRMGYLSQNAISESEVVDVLKNIRERVSKGAFHVKGSDLDVVQMMDPEYAWEAYQAKHPVDMDDPSTYPNGEGYIQFLADHLHGGDQKHYYSSGVPNAEGRKVKRFVRFARGRLFSQSMRGKRKRSVLNTKTFKYGDEVKAYVKRKKASAEQFGKETLLFNTMGDENYQSDFKIFRGKKWARYLDAGTGWLTNRGMSLWVADPDLVKLVYHMAQTRMGKIVPMLTGVESEKNLWSGRVYNITGKWDEDKRKSVFMEMATEKPYAEKSSEAKELTDLLQKFGKDYLSKNIEGFEGTMEDNYFHRTYDAHKIQAELEEVVALFQKHGHHNPINLIDTISRQSFSSALEDESILPKTATFQRLRTINNPELIKEMAEKGYLNNDVEVSLSSYIEKAVRRAEMERTLGGYIPVRAADYVVAVGGADAFIELVKKGDKDAQRAYDHISITQAAKTRDVKAGVEKDLVRQQKLWYAKHKKEVPAEEHLILADAENNPEVEPIATYSPDQKVYTMGITGLRSVTHRRMTRKLIDGIIMPTPFDPLDRVQRTLNEVRAYESFRNLLFSGVASTAEIAGVFSRAKGVVGMHDFSGIMADLVMNKGNARDNAIEVAYLMGVIRQNVGAAMSTELSSAETDGLVSKHLPTLFKWNLNDKVTNFSRVVGLTVGREFISRTLNSILTAQKNLGDKPLFDDDGAVIRYPDMDDRTYIDLRESVDYMSELGITDYAKATKWVNDGMPAWDHNDTGEANDTAKEMNRAVQTFINESVINPNAAERPMYADTMFGRMVFHLQTFAASFVQVVLLGSAHNSYRVYKSYQGQDAMVAARKTVPILFASIAMFGAFGAFSEELRQRIMSLGAKGGLDRANGDTTRYIQTVMLDRAGFGSIPTLDALVGPNRADDDSFMLGPTGDHVSDTLEMLTAENPQELKAILKSIPVVSQVPAIRRILYNIEDDDGEENTGFEAA